MFVAVQYKKISFKKLMFYNPTLIGMSLGIRFYVHPLKGDEAPLIIVKERKAYISDFFEMPSFDELTDIIF